MGWAIRPILVCFLFSTILQLFILPQNSSAGSITSHQSSFDIPSQNLNFSNSTSETTQALQYSKTLTKDTDIDKINDLVDECPIETESSNGHMDKDGCPDRTIAELIATS